MMCGREAVVFYTLDWGATLIAALVGVSADKWIWIVRIISVLFSTISFVYAIQI